MAQETILILCTGNSCRSQMMHGLLEHMVDGDMLRVLSAGTEPAGYVHPLAIKVMGEIGIDISHHKSRHVNEYMNEKVDIVSTVCDGANENCPVFPKEVRRYHWGFPDPAKAEGAEEDILDAFRKVRDQMRILLVAFAKEKK